MTMRTIPEGMRPYERLERCGAEALSDAELLAILIKSGTRERSALVIAEELLLKHGSLTDVGTAELSALKSCAGIGRVKSIRLHAAAELGRRIAFGRCRDKIKITDHEYLGDMLISEIGRLRQEVFQALFLIRNGIIFPPAGFRRARLTGRSFIRGKYFTMRSKIWRPRWYWRIIILRETAGRAGPTTIRRNAW